VKFARKVQDNTPRAIASEQIRRIIATGGYRRDDKLPTYAEWCERLGHSLVTVQRAMGDLADEGLVYRLHGKGCYVGKPINSGPRPLSQIGLVFGASTTRLVSTPYLNQMLAGMLDGCRKRNIDLTILSLRSANGRIPALQIVEQVDATVLLSVNNADYVQEFIDSEMPMVLLDNHIPGTTTDAIVIDNTAAVQQVMEHLLGLGHRRITYLSSKTTDPFTEEHIDTSDMIERKDAYVAQMTEAGYGDDSRIIELGPRALDTALKSLKGPRAPTAFLTCDESMARGLWGRLVDAGVRVPEDVSVAAAMGVPVSEGAVAQTIPSFCHANFHGMGVAAVEALARRCRAKRPPKPKITRVDVAFTAGGSTAAPAG
jgi:DNA-binding LacI/PurR family transcriptional regulator